MNEANNVARYATAYIGNLGMSIVPLAPKSKKPYGSSWITIKDTQQAEDFYREHPDCGIGVNLGESRICSADLDWPEAIEYIEEEFGLKFSELVQDNPTVKGKQLRIMFKLPEDLPLGYCKLNWVDDKGKSRTVFELRASKPEDNRQDVLPPSIHPDTGQPYEWITSPSKVALKEPPKWLTYLWLNFDKFKPQLQGCNPDSQNVTDRIQIEREWHKSSSGDAVCQQYDEAYDLTDALVKYGYKQMGRRWLSPHSESGIPGVHIMGNKCWIHHASDPLCSEDSGKPVSPFDLFTQYEHGGDYKASTRAAAKLLGIEHKPKAVVPHEIRNVQTQEKTDSIIEILEGLPTNKEGKIVGTYTAMTAIVRTMDIGYDNFLECPMIQRNGKWERFDDSDYVDIAMQLECMNFVGISMPKVKDVVRKVMVMNQFDSAQQWLLNLQWDGRDRCSHLFAWYFGAEATEYEAAVSSYFSSAMAARVLEPGAQCDMVPILLGKQGAGKTSAVKAMAPIVDSFTEIDLSTRKDSDLARQLRGKLIGELGELRGLKSKESEWIKAWITRTHEEWTPKFVENSKIMPRRCVFIGTTNEDEFLVDQTGNRRWLPIKVYDCNIQGLKDDIEQIWAQAAVIFQKHGVLWQEVVRLADEHREDHMVYDDAMVDSVREVLKGHSFVGKPFVRLLDVANEIFDGKMPSRADQHRIADALRSLGYTRGMRRIDGKPSKVFVDNFSEG
jgi:hypothetical protein